VGSEFGSFLASYASTWLRYSERQNLENLLKVLVLRAVLRSRRSVHPVYRWACAWSWQLRGRPCNMFSSPCCRLRRSLSGVLLIACRACVSDVIHNGEHSVSLIIGFQRNARPARQRAVNMRPTGPADVDFMYYKNAYNCDAEGSSHARYRPTVVSLSFRCELRRTRRTNGKAGRSRSIFL